MGMQGSVPQFLLDANVAGGLSHFAFYCHEGAEGFQTSYVGFRVRSPSQTLCSANFFHCLRQVPVGIVDLRVLLFLVQSTSAVMKNSSFPRDVLQCLNFFSKHKTQITHHPHLFEKKLRKKQWFARTYNCNRRFVFVSIRPICVGWGAAGFCYKNLGHLNLNSLLIWWWSTLALWGFAWG